MAVVAAERNGKDAIIAKAQAMFQTAFLCGRLDMNQAASAYRNADLAQALSFLVSPQFLQYDCTTRPTRHLQDTAADRRSETSESEQASC
ncbi:hypothetical protein NEIPOLOT_01156 [Neisseria polysaccharea ATCC 43768]|nr:hypothetical protein NEIPOLOT_01156 [Neisseria polysaccharea ATCC 43768]